MYVVLAVFAALVGLGVTGAAVYTAYELLQLRKRGNGGNDGKEGNGEGNSADLRSLLRWTVLDYALIVLFSIGLMFLFVDVLGVLREDRSGFPYYHFGYLLSGFVFTFLGALFLLARLFLVLRVAGSPGFTPPHHQNEPGQADSAEDGVQDGEQSAEADLADGVAGGQNN